MKKDRTGQTHIILIFLILIMFISSILSFVNYQKNIKNSFVERINDDLRRCSSQSVLLMNHTLEQYFQQLYTIALTCIVANGEYNDKLDEFLKNNNYENNYYQIGISDLNGNLYTGMGKIENISNKKYFRDALKGERVISDVIRNGFNNRDIIVLAQPIVDKGSILGVICAEYDVRMFSDLLGGFQFRGIGTNLIIKKDGTIISGTEGFLEYNTFYASLLNTKFDKKEDVNTLKQHIQNGETGCFRYKRNDKDRFVYYEPIGVNDWVMISLVLDESVKNQFSEISIYAFFLMAENIIFYGIIFICVWLLFYQNRKMIKYNEKDGLTLVYNKTSARKITESFLKYEGKNKTHGVLFIDIDNFKYINDTLGHNEADEMLVLFSKRLKTCFREDDIISRFGGDEFLVFIKNVISKDLIINKAQELCEMIDNDKTFPTSISIGISCYPENGKTYDEILKNADTALYEAKSLGKNQFKMYSKKAENDN